MTGLVILVFLFIGVFTLGSSAFINFPWQDFVNAGNFSDYPIWTFGLLMFFAIGIPFFFLTLLGFKLLSPSIRSIGNAAKYTLLAIWLIAISLAIAIGIKQASAFSNDGRVVQKENINLKPNDTLLIKFKYNDYYSKNINDRNDFRITQDSTKTDIIYSNNVSFKVEKTDSKLPYIQIEKEAKGGSLSEAKQRAEQIKYGYKIIGNQLILDNYLITDLKNKFRDQEIEITLFLPEGIQFKTDSSVQDYDRSDDEYFNLHYSSDDYLYKVYEKQVKCLNCPAEENEYNDVDDEDAVNISKNISEKDSLVTTTVTVNGQTVIVNEHNSKKGLSVDKDGKIIKNK